MKHGLNTDEERSVGQASSFFSIRVLSVFNPWLNQISHDH